MYTCPNKHHNLNVIATSNITQYQQCNNETLHRIQKQLQRSAAQRSAAQRSAAQRSTAQRSVVFSLL